MLIFISKLQWFVGAGGKLRQFSSCSDWASANGGVAFGRLRALPCLRRPGSRGRCVIFIEVLPVSTVGFVQ